MNTTRGQAVAELQVYEGSLALSRSSDIYSVYREVYAEPPYCEGTADFEAFEKRQKLRAVKKTTGTKGRRT